MKNPENKNVTVLAETQIVCQNGTLETFENFSERGLRSTETLSLTRNNNFESSYITNFEDELDTETANIIEITLASGETFECLPGSRVFTMASEWTKVENLQVGMALRSVVYNPAHKHPQQTLKHVTAVTHKPTLLIPTVEFCINVHDNILFAIQTNDSVTLIPLKPVPSYS